MSYKHFILPEYDQEMASTRKVFERLPEDKWDWKPNDKSNTIGWNANHIAEIPGWIDGTVNAESWDFAPLVGEGYKPSTLRTRQEILDFFDRNVAGGRRALESIKDDAQMDVNWTFLNGGQPVFTMPRAWVLRNFAINHLVHHRAILLTYLRMIGVPVPGMYGPSGDE